MWNNRPWKDEALAVADEAVMAPPVPAVATVVDEEDKIDGSDKVDESPRLMKMMKCPLRVILNLFQDLGRFVIPSRSEESLVVIR